jgi:hypothetical protein
MDMRAYGKTRTFISFDDVVDAPRRGKIVDCRIGSYDKPVIEFEDGKKLSLNRTNVDELVATYGEDSRDWVGKTIELYAGQTKYEGGERDSVLVRPVSPPMGFKERTPVPPKQSAKTDMSDDVPF